MFTRYHPDPLGALVASDQQDRPPDPVESEQDPDLAPSCRPGPEFLHVGVAAAGNGVDERPAQRRTLIGQHPYRGEQRFGVGLARPSAHIPEAGWNSTAHYMGARTRPLTTAIRRPRTASSPPGRPCWQGSRCGRAERAQPPLSPGVVLDRNRGGAYASMFITGAGLFGTYFS